MFDRQPYIKLNFLFFRTRFYITSLAPVISIGMRMSLFFPVSFHPYDRFLMSIITAINFYLFILGFYTSFDLKKLTWFKLIFITITTPVWVLYWDVTEAIAIFWALVTPKTGFQIVQKYF